MSGALGEFDVPSILQAVSLSRQCTLLRLWNENNDETGQIRVKAGQLLGATYGGRRGRAALHSLLKARHHSFRVERFADPVNVPPPLGPLAAMLLEMPQPVPDPPPLRLPSPAEPAPSTVETVNAPMPDIAGSRLAALAAIEQVVVCRSVDGRNTWEWTRNGRGSAADVRALVTMLMQSDAPRGRMTFENDDAVVVVRPMGKGAMAGYGFPPGVPLGLVRLVVDAAHRAAAGVDR